MEKKKPIAYYRWRSTSTSFGGGKAEGTGEMKDILGGKGAGLAEMINLGIPVPPGFTISTEVCRLYYDNKMSLPKSFDRGNED